MKLYIVNPMYTSLFLLIVFVALSSSYSIFSLHGKTYVDSGYELIFGGEKVLKINQNTITGLKRYRKLSDDEKKSVKEQKELLDIQWENNRKQWAEKREKEEKLRNEENSRRWKQREIDPQTRRNKREVFLKQIEEKKSQRKEKIRQRDEEKSQRGLLRRATPYYGDNSYMGRRRYAEESPMRKAQREKEIQNSLVQHSEQEQSEEDRVV